MESPPSSRVFSVSEVIIQAEESFPCIESTPSSSKNGFEQKSDEHSGIIACFTFCPKDGLVPTGTKSCQTGKDTILNEADNNEEDSVDISFERCIVPMDPMNCGNNQLDQTVSTQADPLKLTTKKKAGGKQTYTAQKVAQLGQPNKVLKSLVSDCKELQRNDAKLCQGTLIDVNTAMDRKNSVAKRSRRPTQKMAEFICRLCEQHSYKLIKIFGTQGNQLKLADKIQFYLPIQVKGNDQLPLGVCTSCVNALNVCNDLYQTSLRTDCHLRQVFMNEGQTKLQTSADYLLNKQGKVQTINDLRKAFNAKESRDLQELRKPSSKSQNKETKAIIGTPNALGCKRIQMVPLDSVTEVMDTKDGLQCQDNLDDNCNSHEAEMVQESTNSSVSDEEEQQEDEKENPKREPCDLCQEMFTCHLKLQKHRKLHPAEERLKCQDCGKVMPNDNSFATHRKTHSGTMYQCRICEKVLTSSRGLHNHYLVHEDPKFCCQICGRTFRTSYKLQAHMSMHSNERHFSCSKCGQMFKTKGTLKQHALIHAERRKFICDICGHAVNRRSHLTLHMNSHRAGNLNLNQMHPCNLCTLKFRSQTALVRHQLAVHDVELPMPSPSEECPLDLLCAVCGNQYQTKKLFLRHKITCGKAYQCQVCERNLTSRRSFDHHMRGHTGEKPFPCSFCDECFKSVVSKEIHERLHTGERPFKCNKCDKAFRSVTNLYQHKATHDAPRKYLCDYCPYKTHRRAALRVHLRVHTGEKPYSCTICTKSYRNSWDLKLHSETHSLSGNKRRQVKKKRHPHVQDVIPATISEGRESNNFE